MGLDMYLHEQVYVGAGYHEIDDTEMLEFKLPATDIFRAKEIKVPLGKISTISLEVGYWRKANAIHNWFIENCGDGVDDCRPLYVTKQQLKILRDTCQEVLDNHDLAEELLPSESGFFFGTTEYNEIYFDHLKDTIKLIDTLDLTDENSNCFSYKASW